MESKKYSWEAVDSDGIKNRTKTYQLFKMFLGSDYKSWLSNPDFDTVAQIAHEQIFKLDPKQFTTSKAFVMQVYNVMRPETNNSKIAKHVNGFRRALICATEAGLIDFNKLDTLIDRIYNFED